MDPSWHQLQLSKHSKLLELFNFGLLADLIWVLKEETLHELEYTAIL